MDFLAIEQILGLKINNKTLFETAFTHRSYLNEHSEYKNGSNERLEFLGDAVLQLISSQYLFKNYESSPEGTLTNYRSAIVNTQSLASESRRLGYSSHILMSHGEEATGGRDRDYILANTFEAVLGAIYLDNGIEVAKDFVEKNLMYKIGDIVQSQSYKDPKSTFQELAQEKFGQTPIYQIIESWGLDHDKSFKVAVFVGDKEFAQGQGKSKQKAQQEAAQNALKVIS